MALEYTIDPKTFAVTISQDGGTVLIQEDDPREPGYDPFPSAAVAKEWAELALTQIQAEIDAEKTKYAAINAKTAAELAEGISHNGVTGTESVPAPEVEVAPEETPVAE